jgi:alcohol dehydrogenase (cytochrome c)
MPPMSSVLATGGGLVFVTGMDGKLHAFDQQNGKELWTFNAGSGSRGGPVSYSVNGKQFVAIPTGLGSAAPAFLTGVFPKIRDIPAGAAMVVFSLD